MSDVYVYVFMCVCVCCVLLSADLGPSRCMDSHEAMIITAWSTIDREKVGAVVSLPDDDEATSVVVMVRAVAQLVFACFIAA